MNDYMPSKFNIVMQKTYLDRNHANFELYIEDRTVLFSRQKSGWPELHGVGYTRFWQIENVAHSEEQSH